MYYVIYNGSILAKYKTILAAINYINKNSLQDDENNSLTLCDDKGTDYSLVSEELL